MSSCVRQYLERFLFQKRSEIKKALSQMKRKVMISLNTEVFNSLVSFEREIDLFLPQKTLYSSQAEYVKALKSFALVTSYIAELIKVAISDKISVKDFMSIAINLLSTVKSGLSLDLGGIISSCKDTLNIGLEIGSHIYLEGSRNYLISIIEPCGFEDLSKEELYLMNEYLVTLINNARKPYLRLNEICIKLGLTEKKLKGIINRMKNEYPEVVFKEPFISTHTKISEYIDNVILSKTVMEHDIIDLNKIFPNELEKAYYANLKKMAKKLLNILS